MSHLRKQGGAFYSYPEHLRGARGVWRRMLWRLGFDPLTIRQRLAQVRLEAEDWKRWGDESAEATYTVWCPRGVNLVEWGDRIRGEIERTRRENHRLR